MAEVEVVVSPVGVEENPKSIDSEIGGGVPSVLLEKYVCLDQEVGSPEMKSEKVTKVIYEECPINWLQFLRCGAYGFSPTTKKFILDWVAVYDKRIPQMLNTLPTEYFLKKMLQACYLAAEEKTEAFEVMNDLLILASKTLKEMPKFSADYIEGMTNLLLCNRKEMQVNYGICDRPRKNRVGGSPKPFETLSETAKVSVYAAKIYFCKLVKASLFYQENILDKNILEVDPNNGEWHHLRFSILRDRRHQSEIRYRYPPDAYELEALGKALTLNPDNVEFDISFIKTLFDCIKERKNYYVQIGPHEFKTREALVEKVCELIKAMLEKDLSVRGILAAASIMADRRIPEERRDKELAESLLNNAYNLWPTHSKILSRLGRFYLYEKKDFESAKAKFHKAMTEDPSDAVSTLNYYWIDSARGKLENVEKIESILKSKAAVQWASHVRLDASILKGCIYFSVGQTKNALLEWEKAQDLSFKYFMTRMFALHSSLRNHGWKIIDEEGIEKDMNGRHIENLIRQHTKSLSEQEREDMTFSQLAETLKNVKLARSKPDEDNPTQERWIRTTRVKSEADTDNNWRKKDNK